MNTTTPLIASGSNPSSRLKAIFTTALIAGTLDLSGAIIVWSFLLKKVAVEQLLQGIASGIFGKDAFTGGMGMALFGVLCHYIIVLLFTTGYFLIYPHFPFFRKHKIVSGLFYAIDAWLVMSFVVLPLSKVHQSPFNLTNATISIAILMVCIGLPISFLTSRYYESGKE